jgi:hypothetical protein
VGPYLEKNPSQKRSGRVAQGVGPNSRLTVTKGEKKNVYGPTFSEVSSNVAGDRVV